MSGPVPRKLKQLLRTFEPRRTRYMPHDPTPRQSAFLVLPTLEAFYGGAAGGGKSDALLMGALQWVDMPNYAAVIVRKSYPQLTQPGGLISRAHAWLDTTDASWSERLLRWAFPSGATVSFRHLQNRDALRNYQGGEYDYIGIDELTDFTEEEYRFLFSRLRRLAGSVIPPRVRSASNPVGPGREWVRRRFIDEGRSAGRIFVPARLEDNPYLDQAEYEQALAQLDPVLRAQLRFGDWTVTPEGGRFRREWFDGRFVERSQLPASLVRVRFWDLAATAARSGADPDYTAGVLLGRDPDGLLYVMDARRTREDPLGVQRFIRRTAELDGRGIKIGMELESGASGKIVIDEYRRLILAGYDFAGTRALGSKEERAAPAAARAHAGDLHIVRAAWNTEFLDELVSFPQGTHDDYVDALSGAYAELTSNALPAGITPLVIDEPNYWGMADPGPEDW